MGVEPLEKITSGETQEIQLRAIAQDRADGLIQTGDDVYYITNVGAMTENDGVKTILVDACSDSSNSDLVVEETGVSVLGPDRAYFVEWQVEVAESAGYWTVGDILSQGVVKCGP